MQTFDTEHKQTSSAESQADQTRAGPNDGRRCSSALIRSSAPAAAVMLALSWGGARRKFWGNNAFSVSRPPRQTLARRTKPSVHGRDLCTNPAGIHTHLHEKPVSGWLFVIDERKQCTSWQIIHDGKLHWVKKNSVCWDRNETHNLYKPLNHQPTTEMVRGSSWDQRKHNIHTNKNQNTQNVWIVIQLFLLIPQDLHSEIRNISYWTL